MCRTELRFQLESERERSQDLLQQEAESRRRVEQESDATKAAVAEAIKDLEGLDRERTELRHRLQAWAPRAGYAHVAIASGLSAFPHIKQGGNTLLISH
jgi:uncharacterized protein (DUF3084 family)